MKNRGWRRVQGGFHWPNCATNCLQPDGQNDNGWDQGMLFLSAGRVWGQPPYYVTQMVPRHYQPLCVKADVESPGDVLDVTARRSEDGKVLTVQVVNVGSSAVESEIRLEGFEVRGPVARVVGIRAGWMTSTEPRSRGR